MNLVKPGKGTTVRILLPCAEGTVNSSTAPNSHPGPNHPNHAATALVVEDEDSLRCAAAQMLRYSGLSVIEGRRWDYSDCCDSRRQCHRRSSLRCNSPRSFEPGGPCGGQTPQTRSASDRRQRARRGVRGHLIASECRAIHTEAVFAPRSCRIGSSNALMNAPNRLHRGIEYVRANHFNVL